MPTARALRVGLFVRQPPQHRKEPGHAGAGVWTHKRVDVLYSAYFSLPFSEFLLGEHKLHFGIFISLIKIVFIALSSVAQLFGHRPTKRRVSGLISGWGTCPGLSLIHI